MALTRPRYVVIPAPGEVPPAAIVGGKAHNLARLSAIPGIAVPPWFALHVEAQDAFGASEALPDPLRAELHDALTRRALTRVPLAVRSSASAEDGASASFAGQFASILGVEVDERLDALWAAIRAVWASGTSAHAQAYAAGHSAPIRMGVLVQALVPARAAGVAFSMDPVSGDRSLAVVSAVYGLGELLVSGESDADTFRVSVDAVTAQAIADKRMALLRGSRAPLRVPVPAALATSASITPAQAVAIAGAARALERAFGGPQDVEWVLAASVPTDGVSAPHHADTLHIVQTRPVTTAPPRGERRLWDNSNIVESYSGVTTPLTFSFARGVYEQVYRQFLAILGVEAALIEERRHVLANMLGLIDGRVYYNLLNWYRVLALLPGYAVNRAFMEQMMGVREPLADPPPPPSSGERRRDWGRVLRMAWRLWREHRAMDASVAAFLARVDRSLAPFEREDLSSWDADSLVARYRELEEALLRHWQPPLVNDFFAMIWFGVLGRLAEKWLPGAPATLVNDLLVGEGGIVSTEPARWLMRLARLEESDPAYAAGVAAYLARFGDRCVGELKLETVPPREDPDFVTRTVRAYRASGRLGEEDGSREAAIRADAERLVRSRLDSLRETLFFWVLGHARSRIRDRENLRFERTRVFGAVRRIVVALGRRLRERGLLQQDRDVFYLTIDEAFAAVAGTGVTRDLGRLAVQRREEFAAFERAPSPPERFETWGLPVAPAPVAPTARAAGDAADDGELRGLGCCPGVVRAPVRVVRDPAQAGDLSGRILVAERTDPGWTLLFPTAAGLLVQRGSLLSHSAIVAREVGLPCVVAIPALMDRLVDGELVEMDGASGIVRRLGSP